MIPFGEWTPDRPDFGNGATVASGVVPKETGTYGPFSQLSAVSGALTARCQGATSAQDAAGNAYNFSGDASKLYSLSGVTQNDVSRSAGYTTPAEGAWRFAQFDQRFVATNYADEVQTFMLGSDSIFSNLSTAGPKGKHVTVMAPGFLMLGNTRDAVHGAVPNRVW